MASNGKSNNRRRGAAASTFLAAMPPAAVAGVDALVVNPAAAAAAGGNPVVAGDQLEPQQLVGQPQQQLAAQQQPVVPQQPVVLAGHQQMAAQQPPAVAPAQPEPLNAGQAQVDQWGLAAGGAEHQVVAGGGIPPVQEVAPVVVAPAVAPAAVAPAAAVVAPAGAPVGPVAAGLGLAPVGAMQVAPPAAAFPQGLAAALGQLLAAALPAQLSAEPWWQALQPHMYDQPDNCFGLTDSSHQALRSALDRHDPADSHRGASTAAAASGSGVAPAEMSVTAATSVSNISALFTAEFVDANKRYRRIYYQQLLLMRGPFDTLAESILTDDLFSLMRAMATFPCVRPDELSFCDGSVITFPASFNDLSTDRPARVIDTCLGKYRNAVIAFYRAKKPGFNTIATGLGRHAQLLIGMADLAPEVVTWPERDTAASSFAHWATAILQLLERMGELRIQPALSDEIAAEWAYSQVGTAATLKLPPDWSANGPIFTDAKAQLTQAAWAMAAVQRSTTGSGGRQEPATASASSTGPMPKRPKLAAAPAPRASTPRAASAASSSQERHIRPNVNVSHYETAMDARVDVARTSAAGLEFCRNFNKGKECSLGRACKFFHLCDKCVPDLGKPTVACHHPAAFCK